MESEVVSLTRDELYHLVWTTPLTQLAVRFGTTGIALARACDDHQIPRPAMGYWSRLRCGHKDEQPPLPAAQQPKSVRIEPRTVASSAFLAKQTRGDGDQHVVRLPDRLTSLHPLVAAARRELEHDTPDRDGLVSTDVTTAANICVSKKSIHRALRIFEAIVRAWERDGGTVEASKDTGRTGTNFYVGEDSVSVRILERKTRIPRNEDDSRWPPKIYRVTGELRFSINGGYGACVRSEWSDAAAPLEGVLDDVLEKLRRHVEHARLCRLDHECERRQEVKAKEQRQARKERVQQERANRRQLMKDARNWLRAQQLRAYVAAVDGSVSNAPSANAEATHGQWIEWANWVVARLDPLMMLKPPPPPGHARPEPINVPAAQLDLTRRGRKLVEELGVADTDALYTFGEDELKNRGRGAYGLWSEVCRILEGHGYDVSDRQYWL